jgi:FemAB-related protein (PEP-CTERM system-associated)
VSITVSTTTHEAAPEWDAFVRSRSGWTPYHLYAWRRVIERAHGHRCVYLEARQSGGALRAVLPLVRVKSPIFGHFLVSMPFLNYGGPLGETEGVEALLREAVDVATRDRAHLLELRSPHELRTELPVSHRKITVVLDVPPNDPEALWNALGSKVRSQVKRPIKEGVQVRFGPEHLSAFYRVFAHHMRDLGTPAQSRRLFDLASAELGESMWVAVAYLRNEPIAAGAGFRWKDRFELVWAASLRAHSRIASNMLLYWRFMERCAADGAAVFDFGRCTAGSGTHRFKAQWGGRDVPLWWYQYGPRAGGGTPSPEAGVYALGPKMWSRLPLSLANAMGPSIVKYIP